MVNTGSSLPPSHHDPGNTKDRTYLDHAATRWSCRYHWHSFSWGLIQTKKRNKLIFYPSFMDSHWLEFFCPTKQSRHRVISSIDTTLIHTRSRSLHAWNPEDATVPIHWDQPNAPLPQSDRNSLVVDPPSIPIWIVLYSR